MMKLSFKNIVVYIFLKYLVFYVFMMFRNKNYTLVRINELKTFGDWFYYLWIFLFMPVIITILFSAPLYFSFRLKQFYFFALVMGAVFVAEYFLYTYLASQLDLMNGVYNAIIGILLFFLFFYRHIVLIFNRRTK
jgi:hypothetical protein